MADSAEVNGTDAVNFLQKLPRELRDRIFRFIVECPKNIIIVTADHAREPFFWARLSNTHTFNLPSAAETSPKIKGTSAQTTTLRTVETYHRLRAVCKQMYHEVTEAFYHNNELTVLQTSPPDDPGHLRYPGTPMDLYNLEFDPRESTVQEDAFRRLPREVVSQFRFLKIKADRWSSQYLNHRPRSCIRLERKSRGRSVVEWLDTPYLHGPFPYLTTKDFTASDQAAVEEFEISAIPDIQDTLARFPWTLATLGQILRLLEYMPIPMDPPHAVPRGYMTLRLEYFNRPKRGLTPLQVHTKSVRESYRARFAQAKAALAG